MIMADATIALLYIAVQLIHVLSFEEMKQGSLLFWSSSSPEGAEVGGQQQTTTTTSKKHPRSVLWKVVVFVISFYMIAYGGTYVLLASDQADKLKLFRLSLAGIKLIGAAFLLIPALRDGCRCCRPGVGNAIYRHCVSSMGQFLYAGLTLFMVSNVLPPLLRKFADLSVLQKLVGEAAVCGIFFSLFLPVMEKFLGAVIIPWSLPSDKDYAQQYSELSPALVQHVKERTQNSFCLLVMFYFDLVRFAFGRGLFLDLAPYSLAVILLRDLAYHVVWHFAIRQKESLVLFAWKSSEVDGIEHVPMQWKLLSTICYHSQRITATSRYLAIAFEEKIDFQKQLALEAEAQPLGIMETAATSAVNDCNAVVVQKETTTKTLVRRLKTTRSPEQNVVVEKLLTYTMKARETEGLTKSVRLHFSNVRVLIENVPVRIFREFQKATRGARAAGTMFEEVVGEEEDEDENFVDVLAVEQEGQGLARGPQDELNTAATYGQQGREQVDVGKKKTTGATAKNHDENMKQTPDVVGGPSCNTLLATTTSSASDHNGDAAAQQSGDHDQAVGVVTNKTSTVNKFRSSCNNGYTSTTKNEDNLCDHFGGGEEDEEGGEEPLPTMRQTLSASARSMVSTNPKRLTEQGGAVLGYVLGRRRGVSASSLPPPQWRPRRWMPSRAA
ncbi:unnamed protein product [Amoebophrya sp. A120]|nr:unnamed protein product [Amoebophrya sp. A120]|eukprot:GSA120T00009004001.1